MIISISGKINSGKDTVGTIIQILTQSPHFTNEAVQGFLNRELLNQKFEIKKWADSLKDIVCIIIGCTREELEDREFKEKELGEEWNCYIFNNGKKEEITLDFYIAKILSFDNRIISRTLTPRLLLQLLGTECGRNIIHPNIWVNSLMSKYKSITASGGLLDMSESGTYEETYRQNESMWIITDTRFPNELKAVKDRGGISIRVNRFDNQICNTCGKTIVEQMKGCTEITCKKGLPQHESETALDNSEFDYVIYNTGTIEDLIEAVRSILIQEKLI